MTEGQQVHTITKQRALVKRTMEQALKGDLRAIDVMTKWHQRYLGDEGQERTFQTSPQAIRPSFSAPCSRCGRRTRRPPSQEVRHETQGGGGRLRRAVARNSSRPLLPKRFRA